jgi:hypothetical protein
MVAERGWRNLKGYILECVSGYLTGGDSGRNLCNIGEKSGNRPLFILRKLSDIKGSSFVGELYKFIH